MKHWTADVEFVNVDDHKRIGMPVNVTVVAPDKPTARRFAMRKAFDENPEADDAGTLGNILWIKRTQS